MAHLSCYKSLVLEGTSLQYRVPPDNAKMACGSLAASCCSDTDVAVWVVREVALKVGSAAAYLPPETRGIDEEVERLADLLKGGGMLGLYGPGDQCFLGSMLAMVVTVLAIV